MVESQTTVLRTLRKGGFIRKGCYSGYKLCGEGKDRSVLSSLVRDMEAKGTIVAVSDGTKVGRTWKLPKTPEENS
jgi:hypothetical protein